MLRLPVTGAVAAMALCVSLATVPAYAETPSVDGVTVTTGMFKSYADWARVSWASQSPSTDSVTVCIVRGTQRPDDSFSCDVRQVVAAPAMTTSRLKLFPGWTYTIAVYATSSSPDQEASPVLQTWDGTSVHSDRVAYYATYGRRILLDVRLRDAQTKHVLTHRPVDLQRRLHDGTKGWSTVSSATTDSTGRAHVTVKPTQKGMYRWSYAGGDGALANIRSFRLSVAYFVSAHLTRATVRPGEKMQIYGVVRPRIAGKTVTLLQFTTTPYRGYRRTPLKTTAKRQRLPNGRVAFGYVLTLSRSQSGTYRLQTEVDRDHQLDGGGSRHLVLTVTG